MSGAVKGTVRSLSERGPPLYRGPPSARLQPPPVPTELSGASYQSNNPRTVTF